MNKTDISWCTHTWNPLTGCKRGCEYCYARRIYRRFHKNVSFEDIIVHLDRFEDPDLKKGNKTIFVGSMSDIEYWPKPLLQKVIDICRHHKQHTFMFLSKSSSCYQNFIWPLNTRQGLTVECNAIKDFHSKLLAMQNLPKPFLSIEPILGPCDSQLLNRFDQVIVGAMTGPGAISPYKEWLQSIIDCVEKEKIHWKPNVLPYLEKYGL